MKRSASHFAWLLTASAFAFACSQKVETDTKPEIDPPSAAAVPPPVDPEIVCGDQHATRVTLHGEGFVGTPIDVPGDPTVALPTVTLSRSHELDGADVGDPDVVVYSGDADADPTNAVDESGEPILVDGEPLLTWTSQEEMSFLVTQDLVLGPKPEGEDDRAHGVLEPGVWDVRVTNRGGDSADSLGALAVVAAPELVGLAPGIVCLEQGPRTLTLSGQSLLRSGNQQVQLVVAGSDDRFALELSDCTAIAHDGLDAEVCETATVQLEQHAITPGYPRLTLYNPDIAACTSEEEVALRVVPAPRITGVVEPLACIAEAAQTFVIQGMNFLRVDGTAVPSVTVGEAEIDIADMECDAPLLAGDHMVELCSSITIELQAGAVDPGLYDVSVVNPDNPEYPDSGDPPGCSSTAADALRIVAPPSIDAIEPGYVCLEDGAREVVVRGSEFLVVDGQPPAVELDGSALAESAIAAQGCDAAGFDVGGLGVRRCDRLVLTVGPGDADLGNPTVQVDNPPPAGCGAEAMGLWTVLPRPTLESAMPLLVCNAQGDDTITLTGIGFVDLDGAAPAVLAGGVAASSVDATDGSCEPVADRDDGRLCTELVATFAAGSLTAGAHDLVVTDAAGCDTQDAIELVVLDPPVVAAVAPNPVCLEQAASITITGSNFVRIGSDQPSVTIGSVAATDVAVTDASCQPVAGATDVDVCTELTATIAMSALAVDSYRVTVSHPGSLGCASTEEIDLEVVPPPTIASVDSANVCTGGGTVTITGTGLAGITARLVDPDTQGVIEALNSVVNTEGTQATITFGSGVQPDTYELVIANEAGCGDTAAQNVVAVAGPVAFFLDPEVAYNGVSLRAILYVSGVTAAPAGVILTPQGGGTVDDQESLADVVWPFASNNNKVGATIPSGLAEGVYDVTVDFATGCDAVLAGGVTIEADATIALLTPALTPQFGQQNTEVAVNVLAKATADLLAGEVSFQATPRVYVSGSGSSLVAEPLRAVAFDNEARLTAIVPDTLPAGLYDLVVINPDGSVGFQAGAYEATVVAPPVIDDVTPTQLDNDIDRPIAITGSNFENPTTDIEVTLECLGPNAATPTTVGPLALDAGSTTTSLVATVTSGITHGSICVVRVTNTGNDTFDEFSALTLTNPASKLPQFQAGTDLVEGRRAPGATLGAATREARFLYAIGGDDGDPANALTSVEAAPIGRFGDLGTWRTLATALPEGVTLAQAQNGGRYIYLFGGMVAGATSPAIRRAEVLDPNEAPQIGNVDLRFFATPDADPGTRDGLAPGAWTYVVAAVFAPGDADNPGGESLRSEPLTLYAPDVPDGVEVQLDWGAVYGADGTTEAVLYRVYRTTAANSPITSLRLLAEVTSPTRSYVDRNPAAFLDPDKIPLAVGDLSEWRTLPAELNSARAAFGLSLANDPNCDPYLYVVGGRADAATESASYEYASFDPATGALGAFTEATGTALTARRELAVFVADDQTSAEITPALGCESYLYASYGRTGVSTFVTTIEEAPVTAGGALGGFSGSGPAPQSFAGHAAFFSSDGAYVMAGASNSAAAVNTAVQAEMCAGMGCTAPNLRNFSSASNSLLVARYLPGFARQGAFFYLIGGANAAGDPLSSTERNVR